MTTENLTKEGRYRVEKERRTHGCDGCHCDVPTQRFDGYCGDTLWLCRMCFKTLVNNGVYKVECGRELE